MHHRKLTCGMRVNRRQRKHLSQCPEEKRGINVMENEDIHSREIKYVNRSTCINSNRQRFSASAFLPKANVGSPSNITNVAI
jgi:hypothetical protein